MNTLRNGLNRMPTAWKTALCGLACVLAFSRCDTQVAGTSVGTGNPTEIEVAFKSDSSAAASITGNLSVYASTQIPVEGYQPMPLLTVDVAGATHASLKASLFLNVADSLWPKGSRNDSERFFNVVVTGENQGAVLKGFTWRKADTSFGLRKEDDAPAGVMTVSVKGLLAPLVAFQGTVDTSNFNIFADYHLFIYGTGYKVKVEHGKFSMQNLPKDSYDAFLLSLPKKDHPISGMDSTSVFSITTPLAAGTSNLVKGSLHELIPLPDSLRFQ